MKKIITFCLAVVMLMSVSMTASANFGGFVNSAFANLAPTLVSGTNAAEDCDAQLIITAYANRETLPEELREKIEEAFDILKTTEDFGDLSDEIGELAKNMGLDPKGLAVSDMFDIRMSDCDNHDLHGHFDVTLAADALEHFVCLLHYHGDFWHIVEGAEVTNGGTHLEFDAMEFSPFAIVVDAVALEAEEASQPVADIDKDADAPDVSGMPADHLLCWIIIIILLVAIIVTIISKKEKKNKK